jgi:hypothetical protein
MKSVKSFLVLSVLLFQFMPLQKTFAKVAVSTPSVQKTDKFKKDRFKGGKIFELNSHKSKLLFTINADLKVTSDGTELFLSSYLDENKNEVMTEEASFEGINLQKYVIEQKQLHERYELKVADGKLLFSVTKDGRTEKTTRDLPENLIVGPSFVPFLHLHWAEIEQKRKVEAVLAVLDYMDTFRFEFQKIRDEVVDGEKQVLVRMKPYSTLISSVVRPVYFVVNSDGTRILSIKGRMLPKLKQGSRWADFEGEAVFNY